MILTANIVFVLGYLSTVSAQTMLPELPKVTFGEVYYIRPSSGMHYNWAEAQQICKDFNATLPIVEHPEHRENFEAALRNLTTEDEQKMGLWLSAKAFSTQPNNWSWLDGSKYSGTAVQAQEGYAKSYAYISLQSNEVLPVASLPITSCYYICSYPLPSDKCANDTGQIVFYIGYSCYVIGLHNYTLLSWFGARNACLASGGDLASLSDNTIVKRHLGPTAVWVGLRSSKWMWVNEVTNSSSDVTFTFWKTGQPDDKTPTCVSTDSYDNSTGWRDWNCSELLPFICQVNTSWIPKSSATFTTASTPSLNTSTTDTMGSAPISVSPKQGSVNVALAVGLGVGIGVPVVILIIVLIIVFIVKRKRRSSLSTGNSKSGETFDSHHVGRTTPKEEEEVAEMYATGSQSRFNDASTNYATVQEARGPDQESKLSPPSTNQGPVYADLGFDQRAS